MSNFHLHNDWQKMSLSRQKSFKQSLSKIPKNTILKKLPDYHKEAFEKVNCLDCAACCKNYSPRFKQPDIKRIAKALKMKEGDFCDRFLRLDEENDYVVKSSPCPFLQSDNTCAIYDVRPVDCRRYPYTDEDVLVKRINLTLKNSQFCPIVYFVLDKIEQELK